MAFGRPRVHLGVPRRHGRLAAHRLGLGALPCANSGSAHPCGSHLPGQRLYRLHLSGRRGARSARMAQAHERGLLFRRVPSRRADRPARTAPGNGPTRSRCGPRCLRGRAVRRDRPFGCGACRHPRGDVVQIDIGDIVRACSHLVSRLRPASPQRRISTQRPHPFGGIIDSWILYPAIHAVFALARRHGSPSCRRASRSTGSRRAGRR